MTSWQPLGSTDWAIPSISVIGNHLREPEDRLAWEIKAVAERLRGLSPARLGLPLPPYPTRAKAGHMIAQQLADAAAGVATRAEAGPPAWREMPEIEVFAVGEQVAVAGSDLVTELAGVQDADQIWTRSGRRPVVEVLDELISRLRQLRLEL